jgi:hypothetical protein
LAGEATLNIYSAEGKLLKQHLMDNNKREIIIDVSALPPGSYSISFLRNGKHIDSSRFIIANYIMHLVLAKDCISLVRAI